MWPLQPDTRPWVAAGVGLLVSAAYWAGGAVWDDHTLIVGHLAQIPVSELGSLWARPVGLGETGAAYYRPVSMTVLALLVRGSMLPVHLLAGLLHALSAALICHLGGRTSASWLGALVFAVHPICWEVLGWASALPDALSVALGLAMLVAAQRARVGWVFALAGLGMLAKESALVWILGGAVAKLLPRRALGAAVAGAVLALVLRTWVGVHTVPPTGAVDAAHAVTVWLSQLGSLVIPFPLTAVRDTHHIGVAAPWTGGALVAVLVGLAVRGNRRMWGAVLVVLLAPALALPTSLSAHLAGDRYMYAGVAGLGWAMSWASIPARVEAVLLAGFTALGLTVHHSASKHWRTDLDLFSQGVLVEPQSAYAWHFLGHAHALQGEWIEAADAFDRARQLPHAHPVSAQLAMQAMVLAEQFERAVELGRSGPTEGLTADWLAWWGRAELGMGHPTEAVRLLSTLRKADGSFDGPAFVPVLIDQIEQSQ